MPKPTAPTGWSDAFGLRRVTRMAKPGTTAGRISNGESQTPAWCTTRTMLRLA